MSATKLAYRINEAAEAVGLSRATIYNAINAGELEMGKLHGRSVIRADVLMAWFERQYAPVKKTAA
jgi:excisionase family DNA binding protein